jgi:hypothetical protein
MLQRALELIMLMPGARAQCVRTLQRGDETREEAVAGAHTVQYLDR